MPLKLKIYIIIFTILPSICTLCAQTDTINKEIIKYDNDVKAILSINGAGLGYELNFFKKCYLEAGGTTWIVTSRVYLQVKYALIKKRQTKLKLGVDLSYINTHLFQNFEISRASPLLEIDYKRWGLQFSMREPFWVDNAATWFPKVPNIIKEDYIIICLTYNI